MTTDVQGEWRRIWPGLRNEIEALVMVAFRLLVYRLDQRGFFRIPQQVQKALDDFKDQGFPERLALARWPRDVPDGVPAFALMVNDRLASDDLHSAAMLAFAIDFAFGRLLSGYLSLDFRDGLQMAVRAVNAANGVLRDLGTHKPMILLSPLHPYWPREEDAVPEFLVQCQDTAPTFANLLPVTTQFSSVDYSAIESGRAPEVTVALCPAKAPMPANTPLSKNPAIATHPCGKVRLFRFKPWEDLPPKLQARHTTLAEQIGRYIREDPDILNTTHIVVVPELTLAPESHQVIVDALASRRDASWIVFPGTYHIKRGSAVVNQGLIFVGGVLVQGHLTSQVSAVKRTAFVTSENEHKYAEDLDGSVSSVHIVDTNAGRIAVMICLDYLVPDLRSEVVSMRPDHLFVLAMSPDGRGKFMRAMEIASDFRTATFAVNAFIGQSWRTLFRLPRRKASVESDQLRGDESPRVLTLEPK